MKTIHLLLLLLVATSCALAETSTPSPDAQYLTESITDEASRTLILEKLDPLPPGAEGLAQRVGFRLPANTVAPTDLAALKIAGDVANNLKLVSRATKSIHSTDRRLEAEKDLSRLIGIVPSREEEDHAATLRMLTLHHRELLREVFPHGHFRFWYYIRKQALDAKEAELTLAKLINNKDIPWIADLLCDQLNEYDKIIQYGLTDMSFADAEVDILARTLCLALGARYSAPLGNWGPSRLKRYAIKQLKRATKRTNLAPADAEAIASAILQLERFQPDPMNKIIL